MQQKPTTTINIRNICIYIFKNVVSMESYIFIFVQKKVTNHANHASFLHPFWTRKKSKAKKQHIKIFMELKTQARKKTSKQNKQEKWFGFQCSNWILRLMLSSVIQIIRYIYFYSFRQHFNVLSNIYICRIYCSRECDSKKNVRAPRHTHTQFHIIELATIFFSILTPVAIYSEKKLYLMYLQKLSILDCSIKWPMNASK